jgi:hypothetical protein
MVARDAGLVQQRGVDAARVLAHRGGREIGR